MIHNFSDFINVPNVLDQKAKSRGGKYIISVLLNVKIMNEMIKTRN